jgi:hypothetical protein
MSGANPIKGEIQVPERNSKGSSAPVRQQVLNIRTIRGGRTAKCLGEPARPYLPVNRRTPLECQ